jgi:hypothetical protein
MKGAKIIGGNGVRNENGFYPTPKEVTKALLPYLPPIRVSGIIWEPACGDLAITNVLNDAGYNVKSTDLVHGDDFFTTNPDEIIDMIITNPPFNLSQQFIEKSLNHTPNVAMLLKTQYWHASKRTKLFNDHPPAYILPLTWRPNFFGDKATGSPTMDFAWTLWLANDNDTKYRLLSKPSLL